MSRLVFVWNGFRKKPQFFPQVLSVQTGPIFGKINNEMMNTMKSHIHLYKEQEKEKLEENLKKKRFFLVVTGKIYWKCAKYV